MENKRRIFRIVTALVTLAIVVTMCVLLVACDPEGKEGGETAAGGGDAIFTEGVTLAELTEKLNAAESFTWSQYYSNPDERLGDDNYVYKLVPNMVHFRGEYFYFDDNETTVLEDNYETYLYGSGEVLYSIIREMSGEVIAEKSISVDINAYFDEIIEYFIEDLCTLITESDGKIVFNEAWWSAREDYIEHSGYVRLEGASIEVGCKANDGGSIVEKRYVISDVNATTVTIPDYIKAAEKDAVLQEEF